MDKLNSAQPVVALSPMDGVTDVAYRQIQKKYGNPDVMFTEFVHVLGVCQGSERLLIDFLYDEIEHPVIAQIYGSQPEYFYHAAKIVAALGFDGVDINMGCPARGVVYRGGGAALIDNPKLAKEIVQQTRKGFQDYFADGRLTGLSAGTRSKLNEMLAAKKEKIDRKKQQEHFTLSIKTRIGYRENVVSEWMKHLTETNPDWISVHGRTLKQMYTGGADWNALATAVQSTHIPIWGNGDVVTGNDAVRMITQTGVKGVLIGRGSYGNPWLFRSNSKIRRLEENIEDYQPSLQELISVMIEHADLHWNTKGEKAFVQMRKNLAWYVKGFPGAAQFRAQLVRSASPSEVRQIADEVLTANNIERLYHR